MREIVVPGDLIGDSPEHAKGAFVENGKTFSSVLGLFDAGKLIPLKGAYIPERGEFVIGIVEDIRFSSYTIHIGSVYKGVLSAKEVREELKVGDIISATVQNVDEVKNVLLSDYAFLSGGMVMQISSVKVPRVIGKAGSMLTMLEKASKCKILVGKNGRIWINGEKPDLAAESVLKIEREAHTTGLTERMQGFLSEG